MIGYVLSNREILQMKKKAIEEERKNHCQAISNRKPTTHTRCWLLLVKKHSRLNTGVFT